MYMSVLCIETYIDGYRCRIWKVEATPAAAPGCFHHDAQAEPARGLGLARENKNGCNLRTGWPKTQRNREYI